MFSGIKQFCYLDYGASIQLAMIMWTFFFLSSKVSKKQKGKKQRKLLYIWPVVSVRPNSVLHNSETGPKHAISSCHSLLTLFTFSIKTRTTDENKPKKKELSFGVWTNKMNSFIDLKAFGLKLKTVKLERNSVINWRNVSSAWTNRDRREKTSGAKETKSF